LFLVHASHTHPGAFSDSKVTFNYFFSILLGFEGFWIAGANFFSDGRDGAVQAAIGAWWRAFFAVAFLWRLPAVTMTASAANLIARMVWVWPRYLQIKTLGAFMFGVTPDAVLIAASWLALNQRRK